MKKSILPLQYGIIISLCLILFFLLFAALGIHTNPIYSLINGFIMSIGILSFLKSYKKEEKKNFNYQNGFMATLFTGFNATFIFTVFFALYSDFIEPNYIANMLGHWSTHYHTPQILVIFIVFIMGLVTSVLLSLTYMQYFKNSWNPALKKESIHLKIVR